MVVKMQILILHQKPST